ncbi:Uncharacterized protein HZ326_31148 [Fusarium oxysporum f. sp. albedinis]|nr:Uncharacterized protein HZ326_31148 [Fusarium oxysporum f. sp. albedinis]
MRVSILSVLAFLSPLAIAGPVAVESSADGLQERQTPSYDCLNRESVDRTAARAANTTVACAASKNVVYTTTFGIMPRFHWCNSSPEVAQEGLVWVAFSK